jgi:hypothetical protein
METPMVNKIMIGIGGLALAALFGLFLYFGWREIGVLIGIFFTVACIGRFAEFLINLYVEYSGVSK